MMNETVIRRPIAHRHCTDCNCELSIHAGDTTVCGSCRLAKSQEKTCPFCHVKYKAFNAQSCQPCSRARHLYSKFGSGRYLAHAAVAKARLTNVLPSPREFACVDCGVPATEYDHRDYEKPLAVDPVCRGCNARRGMAKRKDWSFNEFWTWFHREYVHGSHGAQLRKLSRDQMMPVARVHWPELTNQTL